MRHAVLLLLLCACSSLSSQQRASLAEHQQRALHYWEGGSLGQAMGQIEKGLALAPDDYLLNSLKGAILLKTSASSQGTDHRRLDAMGALLAGNFAAAREIAKLIGEDSFGAVLQQGQHQHIFTALVSEHWMLSVVFDARTPVGLVKVLCRRAAADLGQVHDAVCRANRSPSESWAVDQSFRVLAQHTIDVLLQDGS